MNKMIFFGTPDYVIPILDGLKGAGYEIAAVVTQPPKPVGRKKVLTPSPVAQWAQKNRIEIFDGPPKSLVGSLKALNALIAILEAYGRLIPQDLINVFPKGIINVHPSLLPKYRGASPIESALAAGERETGVSIMKLDKELDHGPILAQFNETIREDDTRVTLRRRLFDKAAKVLVEILPAYLEGKIKLNEQDHSRATFTTLMKKEMGFIPPKYLAAALQGDALRGKKWEIPFVKALTIHPSPVTIHNFIRAVNPWPGAFTGVKLEAGSKKLEVKRLKILRAHLESPNIKPHTSNLILDLVQLEGKNPVTFEQFKRGYPGAKLC